MKNKSKYRNSAKANKIDVEVGLATDGDGYIAIEGYYSHNQSTVMSFRIPNSMTIAEIRQLRESLELLNKGE